MKSNLNYNIIKKLFFSTLIIFITILSTQYIFNKKLTINDIIFSIFGNNFGFNFVLYEY